MKLVVYTDVSCSNIYNLSACGYWITENTLVLKNEIKIIEEFRTDVAEMNAICLALEDIYSSFYVEIKVIEIKTDCLNLIDGWEKNKGNKIFKNFNVLKRKFNQIHTKVYLQYVKGHSGDDFNTLVDIQCRFELREYIKRINEEAKSKIIFLND